MSWEGIVLGFVIGSFLTFVGFCFVAASGKFDKEYEAYQKGFNDGVNSIKNKINEED